MVIMKLLNYCWISIDPNIPSFYRSTPLSNACFFKYHKIVKLLLQAGAYVDIQSEDKIAALHIACIQNDMQLVNILLNAKANVNIQAAFSLL